MAVRYFLRLTYYLLSSIKFHSLCGAINSSGSGSGSKIPILFSLVLSVNVAFVGLLKKPNLGSLSDGVTVAEKVMVSPLAQLATLPSMLGIEPQTTKPLLFYHT